MSVGRGSLTPLAGCLALLLAACGTDALAPSPTPTSAPPTASVAPSPTPGIGDVEPAPGSDSTVYGPNPGAIVVAIEAGHGGCLDWGVPDPQLRGREFSEKAITLAIARALRDRLEGQGISVLMIRDGDDALAGDDYPALDCHGPAWRDVNGDGFVGFGSDLPEGTRTRDELQARLDLSNIALADVLVSLHVDSITDTAGNPLAIARTETFYTDETPWGASVSERLARHIQDGVVRSLGAVAGYERQDRDIAPHNLYIVAPPLFEVTPERDNPLRQPTRGALVPVVLVEIGSITRPEEHELLLTEAGIAAAADGLFVGLETFFAERGMAARIALADVEPGSAPRAVEGTGPPFWAPVAPDGEVALRLTNTGTEPWPDDLVLVAGWAATDQPYLARPPAQLERIGPAIPALEPGESVLVGVLLPAWSEDRGVAWISLMGEHGGSFADRGSPALQLSNEAP